MNNLNDGIFPSDLNKLPLIRKIIKSNNEKFDIIAMGDVHIGHKDCDEVAAENMVKWISKLNTNNSGVILTGDLIENVLPSTKGSMFEMKYPSPEDQIKVAVKLLKPIKNHILMMCDGNHEDRSQRTAGLSPSKIIATELGIRHAYVGYHGMLELSFQNKTKETYHIYTEHGCGSVPKTVAGRYGKLESIQKQVEADIYIKGHIHHKCAFAKKVWKRNGNNVEKRTVIFASNGSYLMDPEYGIRSGFEPTEPGVAKITLNTKRFNIHTSI